MLPKDYITLSRGITNWDKNYGSVLPERQQNEQTLLSYLSPLSYTHKFSNNFTLMAGLRHQKMETRLDWNTYLVNYAVIALKDTILSINTNSITGHQSQIRGDVEISVNATRQVCRFNQYQLYQIPLTVGKSWETTKNWFTELSLGSAVNIYSNNKGRNIFEGDIQDFSHSVTPFLDNRWGFQAMGRVKISYRINEHYGLLIDASLLKV